MPCSGPRGCSRRRSRMRCSLYRGAVRRCAVVGPAGPPCQVLVRRSEDEFVKIILENNRVVGAVLIGKDMEDAETFENLILNEIDVRGIDLLNNQLDLADYFD